MTMASLFDALRMVLVQKTLKELNMHPISTLHMVSPVTCTWLLAAVLVFERQGLTAFDARRLPMIVASAVSGCLVNYSSFMLIERTSSLTVKTLTATRNAALILISALVMHEPVSVLQSVGYVGMIASFGVHSAHEHTNKRSATEDEPLMRLAPAPGSREG